MIGLLVSGGVASAQSRPAPAHVTKKVAAKPTAKPTKAITKPAPAVVAKVDAKTVAKPDVKTDAKTDAKTETDVTTVTTTDAVPVGTAEPAVATETNAEAAVAGDAAAAAEPAVQTDQVIVKIDPRIPAPTATAIMTHYQRVGREIMNLQKFRGTECTLELWKSFRSIKLDEATATKESRIVTAAILQDIQQKISRKKGITISQQCLDNPLADGCL